MVIKTRVRPTSPTLVNNTQVQHQFNRSRNIRQVGSDLDVDTSLTPVLSHLLRQPQPESGTSYNTGICPPTQVTKKDCQRPVDQVSSRRCGLITPRKSRDLYHKSSLGYPPSETRGHPSPYTEHCLLQCPHCVHSVHNVSTLSTMWTEWTLCPLCPHPLNRDVDTSIGTKLMKSVKLRKKEVISLLLLRYTILGAPGRVPG